jgi:hypothetical protein
MNRSISRPTIEILAALLLGFAISSSVHEIWSRIRKSQDSKTKDVQREEIVDGVTGLIGTYCQISLSVNQLGCINPQAILHWSESSR